MTKPPTPPDELVESFKKSSEEHKERMRFSAEMMNYVINGNRQELLAGIDAIRKDFQENTRQIAEELSESASRTAWKIAIFSLFGGFLLGLFAQDFKAIVFQACKTLASAIQPVKEAPKTLPPELQPTEKAQTPKSE
jgi:hypothetical protein